MYLRFLQITRYSGVFFKFPAISAKTFIDTFDCECLLRELWLRRLNYDSSITEAAELVNGYLPIPDFRDDTSDRISTTVVAAFYPLPKDETYQHYHAKVKVKVKERKSDDYINGL